MPTNWSWHPQQFTAALNRGLDMNVERAAIMLESDIITKFPGSGQPGGRSGATRAVREANRSKPGERPHVQLGTLKRSITHDKPAELRRRVGSTLRPQNSPASYALYLEYDTKFRAARPYFRASLRERNRDLVAMIGRKVPT